MPKRLWIAALSIWPGLPQIWTGQDVLGLILAGGFAVALNLAILSNAVWTEMFAPGWARFFGVMAAGTWAAGLLYTVWWAWLCHPERHRQEIDRLYREATEAYLQGRWNESRRRLEKILALDEADADVLMKLGTLFVRTEQPALARRAFRQCQELDRSGKWRWEVTQALSRMRSQ